MASTSSGNMNGLGSAGFSDWGNVSSQTAQDSAATQSAGTKAKSKAIPQGSNGQGAQFVYIAATVANILCENLTQVQINLLANFLSVVTACVYAILTVENPTEIVEG